MVDLAILKSTIIVVAAITIAIKNRYFSSNYSDHSTQPSTEVIIIKAISALRIIIEVVVKSSVVQFLVDCFIIVDYFLHFRHHLFPRL